MPQIDPSALSGAWHQYVLPMIRVSPLPLFFSLERHFDRLIHFCRADTVADPEDRSWGGGAKRVWGCAPSVGAGAEPPLKVWGRRNLKLKY